MVSILLFNNNIYNNNNYNNNKDIFCFSHIKYENIFILFIYYSQCKKFRIFKIFFYFNKIFNRIFNKIFTGIIKLI